MVRVSFRQKPGRRILMEMFGAKVRKARADTTEAGRRFYEKDPDHPGSLGIAISEAVETGGQRPEHPSIRWARSWTRS